MNTIELANPLALLLLPIPMIFIAFSKSKPDINAAIVLPASIRDKLSAELYSGGRDRISRRMVAIIFAWIGIVIGFSGPRIANSTAALPMSGRDLMLAIDLSGSMMKRDFELGGISLTRLELVKRVASELVLRREGDRIGLVIFAEKALAAAPLSFDTKAIAQSLEEMEIGLVGRSTAIGEGLGLALKRLVNSTARTRVVILLSDGANNSGSSDPSAVADLAKRLGIKIFTIGLGVEDTLTHPDSRDAVDFVTLQKVAEIGDGAAFRAHSGAELEQAMKIIESMVTSTALAPPSVVYTELWLYPAFVSLTACSLLLIKSRIIK